MSDKLPGCVLRFLVVGGGIAGLSCAIALRQAGHDVLVFEQSDGSHRGHMVLRSPPHMSRILLRWGITQEMLEKETCAMSGTPFYDGSNMELLQFLEWGPQLMHEAGGQYHAMQHGTLYSWLLDLARKAGADIRFDAQTTHIDVQRPAISLASGETFAGDIIVGADGWDSTVRRAVAASRPPSIVSHEDRVVFAFSIDGAKLRAAEPEFAKTVPPAVMTHWMADGCVMNGINLSVKDQYFFAIIYNFPPPTHHALARSWAASYPIDELNINLEPFAPEIRRVLRLIGHATPISYPPIPQLESWIGDGSKSILVGDAACPTPPNTCHSCVAALEDGLSLGTLFALLPSRAHTATLLTAFEDLRKPRVADLVQDELHMNSYFGATAGMLVDARNASMRDAHAAQRDSSHTAADEDMDRLWANFFRVATHDAHDAATDWWTRWGGALAENPRQGLELTIDKDVEVSGDSPQ